MQIVKNEIHRSGDAKKLLCGIKMCVYHLFNELFLFVVISFIRIWKVVSLVIP